MKTTKIQWCDSTASPWYGCTKVSPGCRNCYAERWARRYGVAGWGDGAPRVRSKTFERTCRSLNRQAEREGRRLKVFPSLCDWLDECVPAEWLADMLRVIHKCPNLDFLLLTKRPENFLDLIWNAATLSHKQCSNSPLTHWIADWWEGAKVPPNIWIGVSCENQTMANRRIPHLLRIPARVRFLSCEPVFGELELSPVLAAGGIHWVIVGGETGPAARPGDVGWVCHIVVQCKVAGVPCFVKQLGSKAYVECQCSSQNPCHECGGTGLLRLQCNDPNGGDPTEWPEDLRVREWPR